MFFIDDEAYMIDHHLKNAPDLILGLFPNVFSAP